MYFGCENPAVYFTSPLIDWATHSAPQNIPYTLKKKINTSKRLQQKTDHVKRVAKQMRNVEAPIIRQELHTPFKGGWVLKVSPLQFAYRLADD